MIVAVGEHTHPATSHESDTAKVNVENPFQTRVLRSPLPSRDRQTAKTLRPAFQYIARESGANNCRGLWGVESCGSKEMTHVKLKVCRNCGIRMEIPKAALGGIKRV
jgi:hypothetical protein